MAHYYKLHNKKKKMPKQRLVKEEDEGLSPVLHKAPVLYTV